MHSDVATATRPRRSSALTAESRPSDDPPPSHRAPRPRAVSLSGLHEAQLAGRPSAELAARAAELLADALGAPDVAVLEHDSVSNRRIVRAAVGRLAAAVGRTVEASDRPVLRALVRGRPYVLHRSDPPAGLASLIGPAGADGVAVPVMHDGWAVFAIVISGTDSPPSVEDIALAQHVAAILGAAVGRERSERLKAHVAHIERLHAVGKLAGGVAHEFNNRLAVIQNFTEFARRALAEGDTEAAQHDLDEVEGAARAAQALVERLLVFSRGDLTPTRRISLNEALADARALLEAVVEPPATLELSLGRALPDVDAAPHQLEDVVLALVTNAAEAGARRIRVATVHEGGRAVIRVADDGPGMPEPVARRALEPFYSTKSPAVGSGLGLPTVFGTVRRLGGDVSLDSTVGAGTTVVVRLPAAAATVARGRSREPARPAQRAAAPSVRGRRAVLVVEDERQVRVLVRRVLERAGYEVTCAESAEQALRLADGLVHPPDALLADVVMPGRSGPELVAALQQRWPGLRIVYMSGYPEDLLTADGRLLADVHLLAKPFAPAGLLATLEEALSTP